MGLITEKVESNILGKSMNLSVYCPDGYEKATLPVLYFLHGRTGDEQLLLQPGIDKAADALIKAGEIKPLRIVCPNLDNSRGIYDALCEWVYSPVMLEALTRSMGSQVVSGRPWAIAIKMLRGSSLTPATGFQ